VLPNSELLQESLPQRRNIGQRERPPKMRTLVTPVGDQDARDAVEVRPRHLRDQTSPDRLLD
jgi:hypothetical protein